MTDLMGTVTAAQANYHWVKLDPTLDPTVEGTVLSALLCTRRSRMKKLGQTVMVGDRVIVQEPDWESGRGVICAVEPRSSELDRPPVANANQILLVFALAKPALEVTQLSRFLVKAELTGIDVCLCLSKSDLLPAPHRDLWRDRLRAWGYDPLMISTYTGLGIESVAARLADRVTVISGPSGVGKSSLINALIPQVKLRTSAVSGKLERGRHTTRHVELFELPAGGLLADTPGFNQPDLACSPQQLMQCFPEIRSRQAAKSCQFSDCFHLEEPNCQVRGDWERYGLYCTLLEEARQYHARQSQQGSVESVLKAKSQGKNAEGRDGVLYEPKLKSKYRQISRRQTHQSVQVMRGRVEEWDEDCGFQE